MCVGPVLAIQFSVLKGVLPRLPASFLNSIRKLVLVVVLVVPLIFWCRGLQWLPRLPLEHLSGELEFLDSLDNNLLDLASIQSLLNLGDILSSLDDAQAVVGQGSGGLAIDGVSGDLFKGLEGIVVEVDELRAGVGVDGQTVEAGGLWWED